MFRVDRAELAETVADEFEATFEQRLAWWRDKPRRSSQPRRGSREEALRRRHRIGASAVEMDGEALGSPGTRVPAEVESLPRAQDCAPGLIQTATTIRPVFGPPDASHPHGLNSNQTRPGGPGSKPQSSAAASTSRRPNPPGC